MTKTLKDFLNEEMDYDIKAPLGQMADKFTSAKADYKADIEKKQGDIKDAEDKKKKEDDEAVAKELADDIQRYLSDLFTRFPYQGGAGGPEDLMDKFDSRQSALDAFKAFKSVAQVSEKFRTEMNASIKSKKQMKNSQISDMEKKAKKVAASGQLPKQLTAFVKKEAKFFIKLYTLEEDEFGIPDSNIDLIVQKLGATASNRIPDAAFALNILFFYLNEEFTAYAKTIAEVGRSRKKAE